MEKEVKVRLYSAVPKYTEVIYLDQGSDSYKLVVEPHKSAVEVVNSLSETLVDKRLVGTDSNGQSYTLTAKEYREAAKSYVFYLPKEMTEKEGTVKLFLSYISEGNQEYTYPMYIIVRKAVR